jgi:hypothetical protein
VKEDNGLFLILGSHAHIPSGASEAEFEYVYEKKMRPFVSNLYRYSNIQAVMHYSGVLLYWVERTHPEFFMLIEDMVARKQAEILGGGFYEPMFPLIPIQDRIGQIELLTTYLRRHFGKRPLGCWLPRMAWEQHMAAALSSSDMNYTFLSQDQFSKAGMTGKELFYPCITEDQGKLVTVFPVSLSIGDELSKKSCSQVFIDLKNRMEQDGLSNGERIVCVFPEQASFAPDEAQDTAWNRFFEELSLSNEFIETILPGKIIRTNKIYKKADFPNSSCDNDYSPRRMLINCGEANGIYSKMIFTSVLINQLKGDKSRKQNAREELWKAQDCDLFDPGNSRSRQDLRKAAYSSLLRAERLSREKGRFIQSLIQHDFDLDGVKEYLFQDAVINCYIQVYGASIFELDYLPKDWNYLDCGCDAGGRRAAFSDILLPVETKIEDIERGMPEGARLCHNEQYESLSQDRKGKSCFKLSALSEEDGVPFGNIEINKCYTLKKDILTVTYTLKNTGKDDAAFCFIPEIHLSFADKEDDFVRFYTMESGEKDISVEKETGKASNLKILDVINEVQILISSIIEFEGCLLPVSENGLYQGTRILPMFAITLESGKTWSNEFNLKFSH